MPSAQSPASECGRDGGEMVPVDGASREEMSVLVAFLILTELIIYFME